MKRDIKVWGNGARRECIRKSFPEKVIDLGVMPSHGSSGDLEVGSHVVILHTSVK